MTRILLVDDHPIIRDGVRSLINDIKGYEVVAEVDNGLDALEVLKNNRINVLITDIYMPELNGIELTRTIRTKYPEIKIIVLTMDASPAIIKSVSEIGAHALITKSNNLNQLKEILDKIIYSENTFELAITEKEKLLAKNTHATSLENITKREREILVLIAKGMTDKNIAKHIHLSPHTVITHRKNLLSKLGLNNKVELTRFVLEHRIHA